MPPKEFGFHVMTHEGNMYQDISWCTTWKEMYSRRFQSFVDQERASQGQSEELERLVPLFKDKVIPRLLRPLGTHGRTVKPVALHADIWCGNLATNAATGEPVYFDPSVFWGHNECEYPYLSLPSVCYETYDTCMQMISGVWLPLAMALVGFG
jgi:protein-ribulosamine 3-kinase